MATTNNGVAFDIEGSRGAGTISPPRRLRQRLEEQGSSRSGEELLASISHRIAAAEEKRESLLERKRAQAMAMSVAKAVLKEREMEATAKRERLEARLRRAEAQRAEYLKQKGGCRGASHQQGHRMIQAGESLARKLGAAWRRFRNSNSTTYELAQRFAACDVNSHSAITLSFEELCGKLNFGETVRSTKELLNRLERWLLVSIPEVSDVKHLLKRLAVKSKRLDRYPARVFLSAFMIVGHPDAVFSESGDPESALAAAAKKLLPEFEAVVTTILRNSSGPEKPFAAQLVSFDAVWKSYLSRFVAWKAKDAKLLEEDLISTACKVEAARLQEGGAVQVEGDQAKGLEALKATLLRVSGQSGVRKLEQALEAVRSRFLEMSREAAEAAEAKIAREHVVNEFMHGASLMSLAEARRHNKSSIEARVKETIEKAFWDSIEYKFVEGQDNQPVVGLIEEIRSLFEDIVPEKWKEELHERVDGVLVTEMLKSGCIDYGYMERLLEYCVQLILSLGVPARDAEVKAAHVSLMEEFSSSSNNSDAAMKKAIIKGLRFVLENLRVLKEDVLWTKIQLTFCQSLSSHDAVAYLQEAFAERNGLESTSNPQQVVERLPRTADWISRAKSTMDAERDGYLAALRIQPPESSAKTPAFPMKTGGQVGGVTLSRKSGSSEKQMKEVSYGTADAAIRFGLLDQVCDTTKAALADNVPETMLLNVTRLRECQNDFQRVVVIATGLLALRQELAGKLNVAELDAAVAEAAQKLEDFFKQAGSEGPLQQRIGATLANVYKDKVPNSDRKLEDVAETMSHLLVKFLASEHLVFNRVVAAARQALRNMLLAGNGTRGRAMAKASLDKVGAGVGVLIQEVAELAERLDTMATVSLQVHGKWYMYLLST